MLSRVYRLHKNRDIVRVMQKGVRLNGPGVRLVYLRSNRQTHPRATVIISAKTAKHATQRNRLKRIVRVMLRDFISSNPKMNVDLVISILQAGDTEKVKFSAKELLSKLITLA